jgi:hypothetical protein
MKLRSGKFIPSGWGELPKELDNELNKYLQTFKTVSSSNPQNGKELLDIINIIENIGYRTVLQKKVDEAYDISDTKQIPLLSAAGTLVWFLMDHSEYRSLIQNKIETFDIESDLLGDVGE